MHTLFIYYPFFCSATPTLKQPLRGGRRAIRGPKVLNTSMEIWEIQKQLKRGEMVQVGYN